MANIDQEAFVIAVVEDSYSHEGNKLMGESYKQYYNDERIRIC